MPSHSWLTVTLVGLVILRPIPTDGADPGPDASARVATVAMHSAMGDYKANLARAEHWVRKAHAAAATFVVLPELCITGSLCKSAITKENARAVSEKAIQLALPRLESLCEELGMTLVVGIMEPREAKFRNSALVIGPTGHITTYHKLWLPNSTEEDRQRDLQESRRGIATSGTDEFAVAEELGRSTGGRRADRLLRVARQPRLPSSLSERFACLTKRRLSPGFLRSSPGTKVVPGTGGRSARRSAGSRPRRPCHQSRSLRPGDGTIPARARHSRSRKESRSSRPGRPPAR
ncbi:MAG: carbon-nitrogen hydrolase family protein [Pirellulales bacterium]|nr:carbon-nitrogen hydrolase family protein [Pirellulales bacterium]